MKRRFSYKQGWSTQRKGYQFHLSDTQLELRILLPLVILWVILVFNSWRNFSPIAEGFFYLILIIATLIESRNIPIFAVLPFYAPIMFMLPRPNVILFALLVSCGFLSGKLQQGLQLAINRLALSVLVFVMFCGLTIVFAPDTSEALRYIVFYVEAFVFLVVIMAFLDSPRTIVILMKAIVVMAGAAFFISFAHYLWRDQMWATDYFLRHAELQGNIGLDKFSIMYGSIIRGGRIVWSGVEPNYWAAQLQFPLWIGIGFIGASDRLRSRLFWGAMSVLVFLGILGTYSRAGLLNMLVLGFLFVLKERVRGIVPLIVLVLVGATMVVSIPLLAERFGGIGESIAYSGGSGRFDLWILAVDAWLSSPIWGHGMSSYYTAHRMATHNTYLQILAEQGLVGLVLYLCVLGVGILAWYNLVRLANLVHDRRLLCLVECGLLGTIATFISISFITAHDARFVLLPVTLGFVFWMHIRRKHKSSNIGYQWQHDKVVVPNMAELPRQSYSDRMLSNNSIIQRN